MSLLVLFFSSSDSFSLLFSVGVYNGQGIHCITAMSGQHLEENYGKRDGERKRQLETERQRDGDTARQRETQREERKKKKIKTDRPIWA